MKKVLSILLSLCLIFTSISCVLTQSVSAEDIPTKVVFDENTILGTKVDVSGFYDPANWFYSSDTTKNMFDESIKTSLGAKLVDDEADQDGDGKVLRAIVYGRQVYIAFNVKKNTNYRLSFYVKSTSLTGSFADNQVILNPKFIAGGTTGSPNSKWMTLGDNIHAFVGKGLSYQNPTAVAGSYTTAPYSAGTTFAVSSDKWTETSFTFNSGDNETLYYALRGSTKRENVYFDGFQLLENYYNVEDALLWRTYKYDHADYGSVFGGETAFNGLNGVANNSNGTAGAIGYTTTADYFNDTADDNGRSIHTYGEYLYYAVPFPALKPNTKYKLTYNIRAAAKGYRWIIAADGTELTGATAYDPAILAGYYTSHNTADEFSTATYEFTTGEDNYQKLWLAFYGAKTNEFYDNIKLEEYVPPKKYSVTFNTDGGSDVAAIEGYEGDALTLPAAPTKTGFEFAGWYTDADCTTPFEATTFTAENITVYAKWDKINPFMVDENWSIWNWSYAVGTGGTEITSANNVTYNTTIDKDSDGKSLKLTAQNASSAIKFDVEKYTYYTLTYSYYVDSDEHTGNSILSHSEIVKDGTLVGKTYQDGQFDFIDRNVSYRLDNGLCATNKDDVIDTTATRGTITQTTTRTWHTVTHEFCSYDNTSLYLVIRSLQASKNPLYLDNFVLTKGDSYTPVTVTFETNGGDAIDAIDTKAGAELNLPEATKDGQKFAGWYTDETLTTAFDGVAKDSDFTLYADWADIVVAKTGNINVADYHLYELGSFGDEVTVSFEYRVVGGTASYYAYAPSGEIGYYNNDGVATVRKGVNGFDYKSNDFDSSTTNWQTGRFTHTIKLKNEYISTYTDETLTTLIDLDAEKLLSSVPKLYVTCVDGAVVYLKNIKFELTGKTGSLDAGFENRAAICAAENSKTGKNGLRVYNEVKTAWLEDHNIVEYGSIVTYKTLLGDTELTLDFANSVTGVAYSKADNKELTYTTTGNGKIHTSYLINVAPAYFAETVVIRNYAITADGKIFYDDEAFELCVFDVLNAMDNGNTADGSEPTQLDKDTFAYFVTDAVAADYVAWCEANKATTGALYAAIYA